ncbi:MAG: hypothetical protein AUK47_12560 [Deltaproteobacteria bacterium CG2_30_63_29]|nr:MAG: hypothetical protein AUK47_12560 [Deltaproteobacteria bacterium CG2_30_63_29]PJB35324.1 MAG: hypothetical protein CO108_26040 [Deltaproteobacteria bacterium CG_4_9_14_3_um_filter_63_12]
MSEKETQVAAAEGNKDGVRLRRRGNESEPNVDKSPQAVEPTAPPPTEAVASPTFETEPPPVIVAPAPFSRRVYDPAAVAAEAPPAEEKKPRPKAKADGPKGQGEKPRGDKPRADKPRGDKPHRDKLGGEKPRGDKPRGDNRGEMPRVEAKPAYAEESEEMEDFAAMFEEQGPPRRMAFEIGDDVDGVIVQIGEEFTFVDLGSKTEAYIETRELHDPDDQLVYAVGDRVKAKFIRVEAGGQIKLARKFRGGSIEVEEAYEAGVAVQGTVLCVNKGGFEVQVMGQKAFCPISQIETGFTTDPAAHIGQSYPFKIIEFANKGRRFVVSRAAALKDLQEERAADLRTRLVVGAILDGEVRTIRDYGAFIDLGGLDGLVHVSEIGYSRVNHPSEALQEGQTVQVKVLSIEQGEKGERISLSIKQAGADPWETFSSDGRLSAGTRTTGTVVRIAPFGAFVELQAGIEGLIHISEMSWEKRITSPGDAVKVGQQVDVSVLEVDLAARRIALSLKATLDDPWTGAAERYPVGSEVMGTVESVAEFGVFVRLEAGLVGLIPMSEMGPKRSEHRVGQEVSATVLAVDPERRRLTLTKREASEERAPEPSAKRGGNKDRGRREQEPRGARDDNPRSYQDVKGSFATLGDLLNLQKKKKK